MSGSTSQLGLAARSVCALALCLGCAATTYRPTEPRPALGPGVMVDIVSIRGAANQAEVAIHTQRTTLIGPVSWSSGAEEPCSSSRSLRVGRQPAGNPMDDLPPQFESTGDDVVFVNLGAGPEVARPGLFVDFKVDTSEAQGCLRLPVTAAANELLWQANRAPWIVSFGVRLEDPLAPLDGTGARLALELRVIHRLGPVRAFFGFMLGGATCRGANCPPFDYSSDDDEETAGTFTYLGGEAGLERRIGIGRWSLGLTLAGSISIFHLGAHADYVGEKQVGVAGPFASLSLFGPSGGAIPGFSPVARRPSNGPELFLSRQIAFGRGPTESAFVAGFGWRWEGTQ